MYADDLDLRLDHNAAMFLAERALGNPRRLKQLVDRSADYRGHVITQEIAEASVSDLMIDDLGLEQPHRDILKALASASNGLSRTSLGQILGLPAKNLDHYWSDLMRLNLVTVDTRHRVTENGKDHVYGG